MRDFIAMCAAPIMSSGSWFGMLEIEKCNEGKRGYHSVVQFKREKAVQ